MISKRILTISFFVITFLGIIFINILSKYDGTRDNEILLLSDSKWGIELQSAIDNGGVPEALKVFANLYANEPSFASDCHDYAHRIGEATYELIDKNQKITLTPETQYCAYGFYHGLMEKTLHEEKSAKKAGEFCDKNRELIAQALYDACYHGIGHGAMQYAVNNPKLWGNAQKLIDKAVSLCKQTSNNTQSDIWRCASGVFMELGTIYSNGDYKLAINKDNPYEICDAQEESIALPCYTQMNGVIILLSGRNLEKALEYTNKIKNTWYRDEAIETISAGILDIDRTNYDAYINACKNNAKDIKNKCIAGLALGFMLKGAPGLEYIKAIEFCGNKSMNLAENSACIETIMTQGKASYDNGKMLEVCEKLKNEKYETSKYCE